MVDEERFLNRVDGGNVPVLMIIETAGIRMSNEVRTRDFHRHKTRLVRGCLNGNDKIYSLR